MSPQLLVWIFSWTSSLVLMFAKYGPRCGSDGFQRSNCLAKVTRNSPILYRLMTSLNVGPESMSGGSMGSTRVDRIAIESDAISLLNFEGAPSWK